MAGGNVVLTMSGDPDALQAIENALYATLDKALEGKMENIEPTFGITVNCIKFDLTAQEVDKLNRFALHTANTEAAARAA